MDVDSSASGAAAGAQNFDEIDDIDAITCLAQIWHQVPLRSVPKRVHVCVSGTTENSFMLTYIGTLTDMFHKVTSHSSCTTVTQNKLFFY